MTSNARKQLENYLDESYSIGDNKTNITPLKFFERYLPNNGRTPENIDSWFENRLYDLIDGSFRGSTGINEMLKDMNIPKGGESQAHQHLLTLLSNKLEGTTKKVLYFSDGQVRSKDTDIQTYRTPYLLMD
jgi:hypothetical protein